MSRILALLVLVGTLLVVGRARADVERYGVFIGNDRGHASDTPLRYAGADAERVRDVLQDLGGLPPGNVVYLHDRDASEVRRALIAMNDRIRARTGTPDTQVALFVYYSGHADAAALHLGASDLDVSEVEQIVRGSAAQFRVLVLDACRSGVVTRKKGGTPAPAISLKLGEQLEGQGMVFLTSTAANEDAQESDELRGSFFTHYFASGLVGAADTDGDGQVQLDEAYRYAYDATLRATSRTWAGSQHPSFRYELGGQGRIALTVLKDPGRATVAFPDGRSYLVFRGSASGPVVAEVTATARSRKLSLRPDRYFVRGRASDVMLEGDFSLAAGETRALDDARLQRIEYARLVRKGSSDTEHVHGPIAGYTFRTGLRNGGGLCHGAFAGYGFTAAALSVEARVDGCRSAFANDVVSAALSEVGGDVRVAHAWDLPRVTIDVGLSLGGSFLHQSFTTAGAAPDRGTGAFRSSVGARATLPLGGGFGLAAESAVETYLFALRTASEDGVAPSVAFRQRLALMKEW